MSKQDGSTVNDSEEEKKDDINLHNEDIDAK